MKKTITCILLTAGLTGYLSAQTPVQDKSDKIQEKSYVWTNKCSWIIYLTTLPVPLTGNTKERNRQLLILRHMVWSLPYGCPSAKKSGQRIQRSNCILQSRYRQTKELSAVMGIQSLPTIIFIPKRDSHKSL